MNWILGYLVRYNGGERVENRIGYEPDLAIGRKHSQASFRFKYEDGTGKTVGGCVDGRDPKNLLSGGDRYYWLFLHTMLGNWI
jgi:hypothetical protein